MELTSGHADYGVERDFRRRQTQCNKNTRTLSINFVERSGIVIATVPDFIHKLRRMNIISAAWSRPE